MPKSFMKMRRVSLKRAVAVASFQTLVALFAASLFFLVGETVPKFCLGLIAPASAVLALFHWRGVRRIRRGEVLEEPVYKSPFPRRKVSRGFRRAYACCAWASLLPLLLGGAQSLSVLMQGTFWAVGPVFLLLAGGVISLGLLALVSLVFGLAWLLHPVAEEAEAQIASEQEALAAASPLVAAPQTKAGHWWTAAEVREEIAQAQTVGKQEGK